MSKANRKPKIPIITEWKRDDTFAIEGTTVSSQSGYWRKVGDELQVRNRFIIDVPAAFFFIVIPFSKVLKSPVTAANYGIAYGEDSTPIPATLYTGRLSVSSSTKLIIVGPADLGIASAWSNTNPFVWAAGDSLSVYYSVPISGWRSNK